MLVSPQLVEAEKEREDGNELVGNIPLTRGSRSQVGQVKYRPPVRKAQTQRLGTRRSDVPELRRCLEGDVPCRPSE